MSESGRWREILHWINGEWVYSETGRTYPKRNPATGEVMGQVQEAGRREVNEAVAAARRSMAGPWGRTSPSERADLLLRVAEGIQRRADEFVEAECGDTGKPHSLARFLDLPSAVASYRVFAQLAREESAERLSIETPDGKRAVNYILRGAKGVVAAICPWNAPLLILSWKVAPALAWGNAVVAKPSEETPTSANLLAEVLAEAGVPRGVYNVIHGFGGESAGAFLTEHPGIDALSFTGETATGKAIMKAASQNLRSLSLELGGKNPAIVFADADLNQATVGTLRSVFANCGQVCLATERVYVERPIFQEFVQRLKAGAESLKTGAPERMETTLGPLISERHRQRVLGHYERARALGAHVVTGGGVPEMEHGLEGGYWIQPTIWTGLAEDSPINQEEIFGPCCHVQPFDGEEEVIQMANDTPYGLACALWSKDTARAERVGQRIAAGILWVNSWGMPDLRLPFGGLKASGLGREGGNQARDFHTEIKNVFVKLDSTSS
ncbi:MAG TPA: 2-hydroxymuconic semialdehyde dehydrogenase [Candidatus Binatia bacterium]